MKYTDQIKDTLNRSGEVKKLIAERCTDVIENAALLAAGILENGGKILICGNGGSAADAQHIAAELVVRLTSDRDRKALPVLALNTNSSSLTACGNDYGFERIFARQVEAFGREGDLLIGISTSGNSGNVIRALETASDQAMKTISFTGGTGGSMKGMADIDIIVPDTSTARIQEGHITIGHIFCDLIERELFL